MVGVARGSGRHYCCISPKDIKDNKGGVGTSFFFGEISLCFICAYLTSGSEKCSE
jgi:hypothetical protein